MAKDTPSARSNILPRKSHTTSNFHQVLRTHIPRDSDYSLFPRRSNFTQIKPNIQVSQEHQVYFNNKSSMVHMEEIRAPVKTGRGLRSGLKGSGSCRISLHLRLGLYGRGEEGISFRTQILVQPVVQGTHIRKAFFESLKEITKIIHCHKVGWMGQLRNPLPLPVRKSDSLYDLPIPNND